MSIKNRQRGSILIYALVMSGAILAINFSLLAIFLPKLKISRYPTNAVTAIYAADSAIEWCIYETRIGDIAHPVMTNGASWRVTELNSGLGTFFEFDGSNGSTSGNPDVCPLDDVLNYTARGTFSGVSRGFEITP